LHTTWVPMGRTSGRNRGALGAGVPPGEQILIFKIPQKTFLCVALRAPDHHRTIPREHTNNLCSGTSWLGGQIRELGAPKESKSETPNLIAPRGDGGFWSCLAKKFFGPSSIFWHMRNFHRGVPYPQNLAPKK